MTALQSVDLVIREGEFVAICGPSGSGKSTLLNLMGLLDEPSEGEICLLGQPTTQLSSSERARLRARAIGFVFQSFELLPQLTALENVGLGLMYRGAPRRSRNRAGRELLDLVGMGHRADALATHLSGGERQRVAVARALAGNPAVLLCDEPTGNLDSQNASDLLDLLVHLNADGSTIVLITHDRSAARRAGRVVTILDGVIDST